MANQTLNKEAEVDKKRQKERWVSRSQRLFRNLFGNLREDSDAFSLNFENKVEIKILDYFLKDDIY